MASQNKPQAEFDIDAELVRRLLADQHPELSSLTIVEVAAGWDNVMFRLGEELAVRLPRRKVAAELTVTEQRWLPVLAPLLPYPIPAPVSVGRPALGYPWPWSVCEWFNGEAIGASPLPDQSRFAGQLGSFLGALHFPADTAAPANPFRGVALEARADAFHMNLERLGDHVDTDSLLALWDELIATPKWDGAPLWLHGDLHPLNVVIDGDGELAAVIDFGDLTAGDPATDLAIAWMIFDADRRAEFRLATVVDGRSVDDDTWRRSLGWALNFAVVYLANSADVPALAAIGKTTLVAVLADPD